MNVKKILFFLTILFFLLTSLYAYKIFKDKIPLINSRLNGDQICATYNDGTLATPEQCLNFVESIGVTYLNENIQNINSSNKKENIITFIGYLLSFLSSLITYIKE